MNRREFVGLSSSALLSSPAGLGQPKAKPSEQPNFLFFIADDLMFRTIHAINNPEVRTPNIDRLVRSGRHFTHCFHQGSWTGAVCVASRTMLNTGLTAFRAWHLANADQAIQIPTWGQTLRSAGYETHIVGKWHLDAVSLQRSFSSQGPVGPGFLPSTDNMYHRPAPGNDWSPSDKALFGHWLNKQLWIDPKAEGMQHSSELYADAAIDYLRATPHQPKPFFLYVGFNAPHDPRQAPEEYLAMYPVDKVQLPPNYLPQHPFDQGDFKVRDELLAPFPRTEDAVQTHRREYYAIISHMDAQIGRVLDALEASGHAKNTYVILTADHGLAVGEHGLMGKQNQYDCSIRMPLIIRGPGVKPGSRVDEMVYQHSMYATTCELAGVQIPPHVEFPSLVSLLKPEGGIDSYNGEEEIFGWLNVLQRSIRTQKHKLIYSATVDRYQVFDLEKDPWETKDLADEPDCQVIKADLLSRLKRKQKQLGDAFEIGHQSPKAQAAKTY